MSNKEKRKGEVMRSPAICSLIRLSINCLSSHIKELWPSERVKEVERKEEEKDFGGPGRSVA